MYLWNHFLLPHHSFSLFSFFSYYIPHIVKMEISMYNRSYQTLDYGPMKSQFLTSLRRTVHSIKETSIISLISTIINTIISLIRTIIGLILTIIGLIRTLIDLISTVIIVQCSATLTAIAHCKENSSHSEKMKKLQKTWKMSVKMMLLIFWNSRHKM